MAREWEVKDIGLLLLGIGALIVAVVIAHWYFFEVLPRMHADIGVHPWCSVQNGKAVVQISAEEEIRDINVVFGGQTCSFDVMYPGTTQVCTAEVNETTVFKVTYSARGRRVEESGVCNVFEKAVPLND